ncbi:membrane protein, putative [plant metagenome]|uniref:Membrane protein, putative n=2 Tax=root TaxID=1 RepID=A0A1C3K0J7_9BURK|nr:DUF3100 domain-containing protein [Orrella dioscoreae]SBT25032.1 membrane protein, putative [Orrella dioscoreae]SOE47418.1 membrane protein, putative [Orrella dioscoreae]
MATIPLAGQAQSASPLRLYVLAIVIAVVAEALGPLAIPLGIGKVVLLPMIWALLIGLALGIWQQRLPAATRVDLPTQFLASAVLQPALLIFIAKLGLLVGGALPKLAEAGWGLLLQEFGNLFGCVLLGMPVALLLGIKREAVGATFSIGREPGLAIIGEKFGMDSPEGRGVLAEYVTGTLIGAIFISIFAGFVTSLNLFHPLALAMGAGVGSGSMTAAAVGAIAAQQTPEVAKDVAAFAAASNLIATTVGTYMTLFISLPFAVWAYRVLEPVLGRGRDRGDKGAIQLTETEKQAAGMIVPDLKWLERLLAWCVVGFMVLLGNRVGFGVPILEALPGVALMVGAVVIGDLIYRGLGRKIPAVCWVSLVAMGMTFPGFPLASTIAELTGKVSFLALITPMLTFAGLSLAKDLPAFRRLGWRIVVVSLLANAGVFLGAAFIAQFFVHTL